MRTDLDHLSLAKRQEIARVVMILTEEFDRALAGRKAPHALSAKLLKVLLFGSYARGDQVVDPVGGYFSDFDILAVVNHEELADVAEYWRTAEDRLLRELEAGGPVKTSVNLLVHSMADLNARLRRGRPFFVDIVRDGILLLDTPGHPFDQTMPLSAKDARAESQEYFDKWFVSAQGFARNASYARTDDDFNLAAFLLHQATERLYHCTLLVVALYSPKSHKLAFLRSQAEALVPSLAQAWPRATRFDQRCFELLRRAYVDARYSPHFRLTEEELNWLFERIDVLTGLVAAASGEHLSVESKS